MAEGMKPYYQDESVTIYNADYRDVLPTLDKVDLVLTDPPYGIGDKWQGGSGSGWRVAEANKSTRNAWDAETSDISFLDLDIPTVIWGGNHFPLPVSRGWLVWRKESTGFTLSDAELAWTNRDMVIRVFDHSRSKVTGKTAEIRHPTEKPLPLMKWCIGFFPDAQTILDPFMGSGTTLRAAKDLNRKAIGIELEERYCEIAAKRMSQLVMELN